MTLLTICGHVADNIGIDRPATIIGNNQPSARRMLEAARRTGRNLAARANWIALVVEHVFFADGTSLYTLPADFRSMINDTMWDRTRYWQMRGAMSPQQWQLYKSSIIGRASIERRWRLRIPSGAIAGAGAEFNIDPDVGATDVTSEFVYEYVSKNWVVSATRASVRDLSNVTVLVDNLGNILTDGAGNILTGGAAVNGGGSGYAVGDIIVIAGGTYLTPAQLIVTSVSGSGEVLSAVVIPTGGDYSVRPANPVSQAFTTGSGTGAQFTLLWGGLMQDDWLADSDYSILSEDLIELGVIWRMLGRLGLAYAEERDEYDRQVDQAVARDGGTQTLRLAPYDRWALVGPYNVQEGNFPSA